MCFCSIKLSGHYWFLAENPDMAPRKPAEASDTDCVISIEYNSELLNHVSEDWEVMAGRN